MPGQSQHQENRCFLSVCRSAFALPAGFLPGSQVCPEAFSFKQLCDKHAGPRAQLDLPLGPLSLGSFK